jgi:hypothetical protein
MKSKLLLFIFLMLHFTLNAQSKFETENWIKEKLETYFWGDINFTGSKFNRVGIYSTKKNLNINFKGCDLIVIYDDFYSQITHNDLYEGNTNKSWLYKQTNKFIIPLNNISKIKFYQSDLFIESDGNLIQVFKKTKGSNFFIKEENNHVVIIGFNFWSADEELNNRLLKAFDHLLNFCKPIKKNEPF